MTYLQVLVRKLNTFKYSYLDGFSDHLKFVFCRETFSQQEYDATVAALAHTDLSPPLKTEVVVKVFRYMQTILEVDSSIVAPTTLTSYNSFFTAYWDARKREQFGISAVSTSFAYRYSPQTTLWSFYNGMIGINYQSKHFELVVRQATATDPKMELWVKVVDFVDPLFQVK